MILALNGAEDRLQIVLGRRDNTGERLLLLHAQEWVVPGQSARFLVPGIRNALDQAGARPGDIRGIACVRGPGGFTGLRLVLSTALGLSKALGIPLAGMDYLPLLAAGAARLAEAFESPPSSALWVMTHARRDQVYCQDFELESGTARPLRPVQALSLEQTWQALLASLAPALLLGSGLRRNLDFFLGRMPACNQAHTLRLLPACCDYPLPETVLAMAEQAPYALDPVEPCYLRASDAETNLGQMAKKRGLCPEEIAREFTRLTRRD